MEARARRRWTELKAKGYDMTLKELQQDIEARDKADMEREISPLVKVDDATLLDTTGLTIEQVVRRILDICRRH